MAQKDGKQDSEAAARKIFACIDGSRAALAVCDASAWVSKRLGAELCLLHTLEKTTLEESKDLSGSIGLGSRETLLEEIVQLEEKKAKLALEHGKLLLEAARKRTEAAGALHVQTRQRHGDLVETVMDLQDEVRVLVMGRSGEAHENQTHTIGSQLENVIRTLHEPIFIALPEFKAPTRALFAFDGSKTANKALLRVSKSPLLTGIPIHVVCIGKPGAELESSLQVAGQVLADQGFEVQTDLLQGDVQPTLDAYRRQHTIDLCIMGAYGHSKIRQFLVGSTTTEMLRLSAVPLLLLR